MSREKKSTKKTSRVQRSVVPIPQTKLPKEPSIKYTQPPKRGKYVKPKATKPKKRKE